LTSDAPAFLRASALAARTAGGKSEDDVAVANQVTYVSWYPKALWKENKKKLRKGAMERQLVTGVERGVSWCDEREG
jgi:hypothetical protein